jgi:sugar phosphate isomerase/epimerase
MGGKLFETHFHDNRGRRVDEHLPVGFGTIPWFEVIQAMEDIRFPGPVTFETTGCLHSTDLALN